MDFAPLIQRQRQHFNTGATRPLAFRQEQLRRLQSAIEARDTEILEALRADLRKPAHEAYTSEIGFVLSDIRHALKHLPAWMKPRRRRLPLIAWPGKGCLLPEPLGDALIIGPWNYPFQLLFSPLVGALAAGNCVVLKPSEFAPHTARVISELIADTFPSEYITVVEGDRKTAEALLLEKFDAIFFTGSTSVGKSVMAAAARHLTPVTLELGGKCPAIVCADAPLEMTARRIAWGKFMNAGQTCVAPDFVLVERQVFKPLLEALRRVIREFYGDNPQTSPDYGRIINRGHFDRLIHCAASCKCDAEDLYIAPTLLPGVSWEDAVMQEEIFGPILPVLPFDSIDEVPSLLRERPSPLALYLFTNDRAIQDRIVAGTRSGGVCINDTIVHMLGQDLPFGGVGESGMGKCHGKAGFECFSHERAIVRRFTSFDLRFRYPPAKLSLEKLKKACRFLMGG